MWSNEKRTKHTRLLVYYLGSADRPTLVHIVNVSSRKEYSGLRSGTHVVLFNIYFSVYTSSDNGQLPAFR